MISYGDIMMHCIIFDTMNHMISSYITLCMISRYCMISSYDTIHIMSYHTVICMISYDIQSLYMDRASAQSNDDDDLSINLIHRFKASTDSSDI